jgi:hypothetical protein
MDGITLADRKVRNDAAKVDATFLNALRVGGPDQFVWNDNWRGNQWAVSASSIRQREAAERHMADKEAMRERVVSRDAMPCCGVRADLHEQFGCRRRPA